MLWVTRMRCCVLRLGRKSGRVLKCFDKVTQSLDAATKAPQRGRAPDLLAEPRPDAPNPVRADIDSLVTAVEDLIVIINDELREISAAWLKCKGSQELGFVLGSLGLDHPSAKRYFIARAMQGTGRIEGFIVCEPIYGRSGYYLDVTRRRLDSVRGTIELLTAEILRLLRDEGCEMASLGLAPLALLDDPDLLDHPVLARLMRFVYERININYDFKLLYRYKAKYHPHTWEPRYFCFNQRRLSLSMLYAVIQVRNALRLEMLLGRRGLPEKIKTWKHAASFIVGFCWALLSSSS